MRKIVNLWNRKNTKRKLQKSFKEGIDEAMNLVFKKYGLVGVVGVLLRVMKFIKKRGDSLNG